MELPDRQLAGRWSSLNFRRDDDGDGRGDARNSKFRTVGTSQAQRYSTRQPWSTTSNGSLAACFRVFFVASGRLTL